MLKEFGEKIKEIESLFSSYARVQLSSEEWLSEKIIEEMENRATAQIDISQRVTREYIAEVKARYQAEITAAREAMQAQVSMYQQQIKEIDEALKAMGRQEKDDNFDERIRRLQAVMAYEVDPPNIYAVQREIDRLTEENNSRLARQSLEDERDSLREKISAARDHFSEQQRILNNLKDEEVRLAEERVEIQAESLAKQQAAFKESEGANTKQHREELSIRGEHLDKFLKAKLRLYDETAKNIRIMMQNNNFNMLRDLEATIPEILEIGRRAGESFFDGFKIGTGGMAEYITDLLRAKDNKGSGGADSYSLELGAFAAPVNTYNISIEQDFNVPVLTPSRVADETQVVMASIARSIK